jgi:hypothetical protein
MRANRLLSVKSDTHVRPEIRKAATARSISASSVST